MEMKPILAARYSISYLSHGFSGEWGRWKFLSENKPVEYHHNPQNLLHNGENDIASVYMPVIGPYDSGDTDLVEYQILLAKAVGIDAFIVDYYGHAAKGINGKDAAQVQMLLTQAEQLDFKIALCFNDESCFPPIQSQVTNRNEALDQARDILQYAEEHFFTSAAYLRIEDKPLLTINNCGKTNSAWDWHFFTAKEWDQLRGKLATDIFLIQNYQAQMQGVDFSEWDSVAPGIKIYFSDYDTDEMFWENSKSVLGKGRYQFISGMVNPGYDDRGCGGSGDRGPRVFSRRQGEKYSATWEDNLRNQAQFIQIGTWNNYAQGTGIEPVKEILLHKSAAVPGWGYRELITTREYAVRFTNKKIWPLPALFLPERLYRLRKSGAPATRGDRIRLYLLEGDVTGSTLGLEHAGV
jgi:glycosyl hydrolase family 99